MIIGIGTDLVEMKRMDRLLSRWGMRALQRLFTPSEIEQRTASSSSVHHFAKRFAAKEALVKALGVGFSQKITFKDIEVSNDDLGKPYLSLQGVAAEKLNQRIFPGCQSRLHLSLSDTQDHALAFVVIEQISIAHD